MSDQTDVPEPREKCDHICLLDADHVERGVLHQYGYELPSPRALAAQVSTLQRESATPFVNYDPDEGACSEGASELLRAFKDQWEAFLAERDALAAQVSALRQENADLREAVDRAEEFAAEGWKWLDDALAALGVETVFDIPGPGE